MHIYTHGQVRIGRAKSNELAPLICLIHRRSHCGFEPDFELHLPDFNLCRRQAEPAGELLALGRRQVTLEHEAALELAGLRLREEHAALALLGARARARAERARLRAGPAGAQQRVVVVVAVLLVVVWVWVVVWVVGLRVRVEVVVELAGDHLLLLLLRRDLLCLLLGEPAGRRRLVGRLLRIQVKTLVVRLVADEG